MGTRGSQETRTEADRGLEILFAPDKVEPGRNVGLAPAQRSIKIDIQTYPGSLYLLQKMCNVLPKPLGPQKNTPASEGV